MRRNCNGYGRLAVPVPLAIRISGLAEGYIIEENEVHILRIVSAFKEEYLDVVWTLYRRII